MLVTVLIITGHMFLQTNTLHTMGANYKFLNSFIPKQEIILKHLKCVINKENRTGNKRLIKELIFKNDCSNVCNK